MLSVNATQSAPVLRQIDEIIYPRVHWPPRGQLDESIRAIVTLEGQRLETHLEKAYETILNRELEGTRATLSEEIAAVSTSMQAQTRALAEQTVSAPWIYGGIVLALLNMLLLLVILITKASRWSLQREQAGRDRERAEAAKARSRMQEDMADIQEQLSELREKGDSIGKVLRKQRDAFQQTQDIIAGLEAPRHEQRREALPAPTRNTPFFPRADMEALLRDAIAAGASELSGAVAPGIARAFLTGLGGPQGKGSAVWLPVMVPGPQAPYYAWSDGADGPLWIYPNRLQDLPDATLLFDGIDLCATITACEAPATGMREGHGVQLSQRGRLRAEYYHPPRVVAAMRRVNELLAKGKLSFERIGNDVLPVARARGMNTKAGEPVRVVKGGESVPLCGLIERGRLYVLPAQPVVIPQGVLHYGAPGIFKGYDVGGRVCRVVEPAIASPLDERGELWDANEWGRVEMER